MRVSLQVLETDRRILSFYPLRAITCRSLPMLHLNVPKPKTPHLHAPMYTVYNIKRKRNLSTNSSKCRETAPRSKMRVSLAAGIKI